MQIDNQRDHAYDEPRFPLILERVWRGHAVGEDSQNQVQNHVEHTYCRF
jgi:hypothetical protein